MRLHLPSSLRRALMNCLFACVAPTLATGALSLGAAAFALAPAGATATELTDAAIARPDFNAEETTYSVACKGNAFTMMLVVNLDTLKSLNVSDTNSWVQTYSGANATGTLYTGIGLKKTGSDYVATTNWQGGAQRQSLTLGTASSSGWAVLTLAVRAGSPLTTLYVSRNDGFYAAVNDSALKTSKDTLSVKFRDAELTKAVEGFYFFESDVGEADVRALTFNALAHYTADIDVSRQAPVFSSTPGVLYQYVVGNDGSGSWSKYDASTGSWTENSTPERSSNRGPILVFDNVGTVTSANCGVDTSDGGGIKVSGNSIVTVNHTKGGDTWGGSLWVEAGSELTTEADYWKNSESVYNANFYIDGKLTLDQQVVRFATGDTGDQYWHIGAEGHIDLTTVTSVDKQNQQLTVELIAASAEEVLEGVVGRSYEVQVRDKTYISSESTAVIDAIDVLQVLNSAGKSMTEVTGDQALTAGTYKCVSDGGNLTIQFLSVSYEAMGLTWSGADGAVWQHGATGWQSGDTAVVSYLNGDTVNFANDGSAVETVTVSGTVAPASINVAGKFIFDGEGSIAPAGTTTLSANAELTVQNTGDNAWGDIVLGADSTMTLSSDAATALASTISGSGTLVKAGAGTMLFNGTLGGSNTFRVDGGTLELGGTAALGKYVVGNGGTLDVKGMQDKEWTLTLEAGGCLTNTGSDMSYGAKGLEGITLTGDATVKGTMRINTIASGHDITTLELGGHTLTKEGSNTLYLQNMHITPGEGGTIKVSAGMVDLVTRKEKASFAADLGGTALEVNGGTFRVRYYDADPSSRAELTHNAASLKGTGGTVEIGAKNVLNITAATGTYSGSVTGVGTLQVSGGSQGLAGEVTVNSVKVSGGELTLAKAGSLETQNLSIEAGSATFNGDVTAASLTNRASVAFNGAADFASAVNEAGASMTINGALAPTSVISNAGLLTFGSGASINLGSLELGTTMTLVANSGEGRIEGWDQVNFHASGLNIYGKAVDTSVAGLASLRIVGIEDALVWQGRESGNWDATSLNWAEPGGEATEFAALAAVRFGEAPLVKAIGVASDVIVSNMQVSGSGYTFSGAGDIIVKETLTVDAQGGTTAFDAAVNAQDIVIEGNASGSATHFNGVLTADSLRLVNGTSSAGGSLADSRNIVKLAAGNTIGELLIEGDNFTLGGSYSMPKQLTITGGGTEIGMDTQYPTLGISSGSQILLAAKSGSTTTFNLLLFFGDSLKAGAEPETFLKIENCLNHGNEGVSYAGAAEAKYVFEDGISSYGANVDVHLDSVYKGLDASTLFVANGPVNIGGAVASTVGMTLTGTGRKEFNGNATFGFLTVGGAVGDKHDEALEGIVTFRKELHIYGDLVIQGHSEAVLYGDFSRGAENQDQSRLIIKDGMFSYQRNSGGAVDYLGTIILATDSMSDAEMTDSAYRVTAPDSSLRAVSVGPLTHANALVEAHGLDFTVRGSARSFDLALHGGHNLSVEGGNVYLGDTYWRYVAAGATGAGILENEVLTGDISVSGSAYLELCSDTFAETASGNISISNASLHVGKKVTYTLTYTQTDIKSERHEAQNSLNLYGNISMHNGFLSGAEDSRIVVVTSPQRTAAAGDERPSLTFSGDNQVDVALELGENDFVFRSEGATRNARENRLFIKDDISGTGTLTVDGMGTVEIDSALTFSGTIHALNNAVLAVNNDHALANVRELHLGSSGGAVSGVTYLGESKTLTIGAGDVPSTGTLSINHGGTTNVLGGIERREENGVVTETRYGDLYLASGSRMNFSNLVGHEDTAALTVNGKVWFTGGYEVHFSETDGTASELTNLTTYKLVAAYGGIDRVKANATDPEPDVLVYVGETKLNSDQYQFASYEEGGVRYLTFTTLRGRTWTGGAGDDNNWHTAKNWDTDGSSNEALLLRHMEGVSSVDIALTKQADCPALYMDGHTTDYTITSTAGAGVFRHTDSEGNHDMHLVKRGTATMTWSGVQGTIGRGELDQGVLHLTGNSSLGTDDRITIADQYYAIEGTTATLDTNGATLYVDAGSTLAQGEATLTGSGTGIGDNGTAAALHGVTIEGQTISGEGYKTHTISNAVIDGFALDTVQLGGVGKLGGFGDTASGLETTLGGNVSIASGATYELGADVRFESTVANAGTVKVTSGSSLIIDHVDSVSDGNTATYTIFNGGSYTDWDRLTTGNFTMGGLALSNLAGVTVDVTRGGSVAVSTAEGYRLVSWDAEMAEGSNAPVMSKLFVPGEGSSTEGTTLTSATVVTQSGEGSAYNYAGMFAEGKTPTKDAANTYVATLGQGSGGEGMVLVGVNPAVSSKENRVDVWLSYEGATYAGIAAGAGVVRATVKQDEYHGNSHLQVNEELNASNPIIGGSLNVVQHGDSHLTVNANVTGTQVVGGSYMLPGDNASLTMADTYHDGASHLHITNGKIENAIGGSYQTYTGQAASTDAAGNEVAAKAAGTHVQISGGEVENVYGGDFTTTVSTHTGNVEVDIAGGSVTNVYGAGGADNLNKVDGNVQIAVTGGETQNVYGVSAGAAGTVTGNVTIDLKGGGLANVTAVQYTGAETGPVAVVGGDVMVNVYAAPGGNMASMPALNPDGTPIEGLTYQIDGGRDYVAGDSVLHFNGAGLYDFAGANVALKGFDRFSLDNGAHVTMGLGTTDSSGKLTIGVTQSGDKAMLTMTGGSTSMTTTGRNLVIEKDVTLNLRTDSYGGAQAAAAVAYYPTITVQDGATVDITDCPGEGADLGVHLVLEGNGVDGRGALYKGDSTVHADEGSKPMLGYITLSGNASVGGESAANAVIYVAAKNIYDYASVIDLTDGGTAPAGGHVFTKQGDNVLELRNTDVFGGTLNVVQGELRVAYSSAAGDTDVVLREGATLSFVDESAGYDPHRQVVDGKPSIPTGMDYSDGQQIGDFNAFAVNSLSGSGTVDLGSSGGLLYFKTSAGAENFSESFRNDEVFGLNTLPEGEKPLEYAIFDGKITGYGRVTKDDAGRQALRGAESDYTGETHISGGELLLLAGSTLAKDENGNDIFRRGETQVVKGVIGTASLVWEATETPGSNVVTSGAVYLDNGVRIHNGGRADAGVRMSIGVGMGEGGSYHTATYSGVLSGAGSFEKVGKGTLIFDQQNAFTGGGYVSEGTLRLQGWASLDEGTIAPAAGATLMLAYGNYANGEDAEPYAGEEISEAVTNFTLTGSGDARWASTSDRLDEHGHTAALISNIGEGRQMTLNGVISSVADAEGVHGGLMHCSEGTLILAGKNTYEGGTIITAGKVVVTSDTGLGATATASTASVKTHAGTTLEIANASQVTLAAKGNVLEGNVVVGEGSSLVFRGADSSIYTPAATAAEGDATHTPALGTLSGAGTVVVSDVAGGGTSAAFVAEGFTGDIVVEGDAGLLHIESGSISGNVSVSGDGARVEARKTDVTVQGGKRIALTSDDGNKAATFAAKSVSVENGGIFSVTAAETVFAYSDAGAQQQSGQQRAGFSMNEALGASSAAAPANARAVGTSFSQPVGAVAGGTPFGSNGDNTLIADYNRAYMEDVALNTQVAGRVETGELVFGSGATYMMDGGNTDVAGAPLTLNVTPEVKLNLVAQVAPEANIKFHKADMASYETSSQLVLFTGVTRLTINFDEVQAWAPMTQGSGVYVTLASNVFNVGGVINENTALVYDSGAGVVYLDGFSSVPEPTTTTLTLLALAALCARRRRRQD